MLNPSETFLWHEVTLIMSECVCVFGLTWAMGKWHTYVDYNAPMDTFHGMCSDFS